MLPVNVDWQSGWWRSVTMLLTLLWMMIAWVFFRGDSIAEASNVLGGGVGLHPHPGVAVAPLEPWILLIIAIDHVLGSGALRCAIPGERARALSWGGIGMLLALGLATIVPYLKYTVRRFDPVTGAPPRHKGTGSTSALGPRSSIMDAKRGDAVAV
jgi:hypothetical protein